VRALTPKQLHFCEVYLKTGNASEAYRQAYDAEKMKATTIERNACALLKHNKVAALIQAERDRAAKKFEITIDRTLKEIARLAYSDPRKFYDAEGNLIPVHLLDDDAAACVASVEVDEITAGENVIGYTKKIKHWDKNAALDKAMKFLRLYGPDKSGDKAALPDGVTEVTLRISGADRIMVAAAGGGSSGAVSVVRKE
jgi:phage terminase small subunit